MSHDLKIAEDEWWACRFPERPRDSRTWYDDECRGCTVALMAEAELYPDTTIAYFDDDGVFRHRETLVQAVAKVLNSD